MLKLYIWPKVKVSESLSNFKVKVHITVKKGITRVNIGVDTKNFGRTIYDVKLLVSYKLHVDLPWQHWISSNAAMPYPQVA